MDQKLVELLSQVHTRADAVTYYVVAVNAAADMVSAAQETLKSCQKNLDAGRKEEADAVRSLANHVAEKHPGRADELVSKLLGITGKSPGVTRANRSFDWQAIHDWLASVDAQ